MLRLLSLEYLKLRKTKGFWLLCGLFVLALASIPLATKYWLNYEGGFGELIGSFIANRIPIFDFVDIWQNLAFIFKYISILLGFIVIISITNEFSYKTMRQNIIDGLSKREYLISKLLGIFVLALLTTMAVFIIGLIMGYNWSPVTEMEFVFKKVDILFGYFLHLIGFFLLCMLIGLLIKRAGLAIALSFFYVFLIEPIITSIVRYKFGLEMLADSFPYRATMAVIPNPFGKYALMEVQDFIPWQNLLVLLAYIVLLIWLCWLLISKRDL